MAKNAEDDRELQNLRDLLLKKSEEIMLLKKRNTDLEGGMRTKDDEIRRLKRELDERDKTIKGLRHSRVSVRGEGGGLEGGGRVGFFLGGRYVLPSLLIAMKEREPS